MVDETAKIFLSFLKSEKFLALWKLVNDRPVSWNEFRTLEMPEGLSPEDAWEATSHLRMEAGIVFPYPPYFKSYNSAESLWFSVPKETQSTLQRISETTARGSRFSSMATQYLTPQMEARLMLPQYRIILARDGIFVEPDRALDICLGRLKPNTPHEMILLRLFVTASSLKGDRRPSRGLIENFYEALYVQGAEDAPRNPRAREISNDKLFSTSFVLDALCDLFEGDFCESPVHPILAALEATFLIHDHMPLPTLNACVAYLVHKEYFLRSMYPGIAYLSFWNVMSSWEARLAEGAESSFRANEKKPPYVDHSSIGCDGTLGHAVALDIIEQDMSNLAKRLESQIKQLEHHVRTLSADHRLNARQSSCLHALMRDGRATISVKEYCKRFDVAYATGRSDLLQMVDADLLRQIQEENGFRYTCAQSVLDLIIMPD